MRIFQITNYDFKTFNTFGQRQSARAVIPTIISQILKQGKIELGSLFPTRDFTYVEIQQKLL